jgi:CRISPR-associated protein Cas2
MWMMVMFDLPVGTAQQRKKATKFRNELGKEGFSMCQFSVYARFCGSREKTDGIYRTIEAIMPEEGKVDIIIFTDKQFGQIVRIKNNKRRKKQEMPDQLLIFSDEDFPE